MEMKMLQLDPTANMGQVGSSVLRAIQNNSDPLIDLFIRESIQNSLDAGNKSISVPYVNVDFIVKKFNAKKLNHSLDGITDRLNKRFPDEYYKFVAVKDTNTTGLTGPLKRSEVRDNKYGNLQKLVYHVGKPQEELGAGGSWGYGKTLYYRISQIGLVIYYSRIKKENGEYESRLCAVMCENEKSNDAILPPYDNNNNKSGIAWWGDIDDKSNSYPITDEDNILFFLETFGITPYVNDEVGTIVIIPYINEQALLNENSFEPNLDFEGGLFWNSDKKTLEEEFRIAIQRWYSPRLNNPQYQSHFKRYGKVVKYLKASINGEEITEDQMLPIFRRIQELYNSAIIKMDNESISNDNISTEVIRYNSQDVGVFAYILIKKEELTDNDNSPYPFLNIDFDNRQGNIPIICMTRQPGMIVEYNPSSWGNLPITHDDDYILAFFVLDSRQKLSFKDGVVREIELEEYVRQSECADHLGWQDHAIENSSRKIRCIGKITNQCCGILNEKFSAKSENEETKTLSGLSVLLGKILAIHPSKKGVSGGHSHREVPIKDDNGIKYTIGDDISYSQNSISFTVKAMSKKEISKTILLLGTTVDSSFIDCDKWEKDTGLISPFSIENYMINDCHDIEDCFDISLIKTNKHGETYGLKFTSKNNQKHLFSADLTMTILLKRKDLRPNIKF
jgi:hypothetical protein